MEPVFRSRVALVAVKNARLVEVIVHVAVRRAGSMTAVEVEWDGAPSRTQLVNADILEVVT